MLLRIRRLAIALVLCVSPALGQHLGVKLPVSYTPRPETHDKINYHGGPIMTGTNHIYVVYYGSFLSTTTDIIDTFIEHLGGSGAFNVNTTYHDRKHRYVRNSLAYSRVADAYYDYYSMGRSLDEAFDLEELSSVLGAGYLPTDERGIYIMIFSPDVQVPDGAYCGYHDRSGKVVSGKDIKYAVIPDPSSKQYACSGNVAIYHERNSPNGDIGADSVCDTLIHEISETVTDPDYNAWWGKRGENGDLCNYVYGSTFLAPNGTHANQTFGGRNYLVQTIWQHAASGFCANSLP